MYIKYILMVLLLLITISIIREKNNFKLVILFSGFSLIAASIYFYNNALDVALAEIAVGSAFIPLIFLIAISKQRTFSVMNNTNSEFEYMDSLIEFCKEENLELKFFNENLIVNDEAKSIHGAFRRKDIDLIIQFNHRKNRYEILGKKSNVMIKKYQELTKKNNRIHVIRISDMETVE